MHQKFNSFHLTTYGVWHYDILYTSSLELFPKGNAVARGGMHSNTPEGGNPKNLTPSRIVPYFCSLLLYLGVFLLLVREPAFYLAVYFYLQT